MAIKFKGMEAVKNVIKITVDRVEDMKPAMEGASKEWNRTIARSFAAKRGPDGTQWAPKKEPNGKPVGFESGRMFRGQASRGLRHSLQGLGDSKAYWTHIFKVGAAIGNRAAGFRKKKADRLAGRRRARGFAQKGGGQAIQFPRPIAPVEVRRGKAKVLDPDFIPDFKQRVARYVTNKDRR